jgi:GNAT superfamily N-acetyltransferase
MPTSRARLRRAAARHLPALIDLAMAATEVHGCAIDREVVAAVVRRTLGHPRRQRWWVLELDGVTIGALATTYVRTERDEPCWWLRFLFVRPDMHGRGITRQLVEDIAAIARDARIAELRLRISPEDTRTLRACQDLGFSSSAEVASRATRIVLRMRTAASPRPASQPTIATGQHG